MGSTVTASPARFYSLSRGAYSGTGMRDFVDYNDEVSIRCREGRTAERESGQHLYDLPEFLFAVARGVQRNTGADQHRHRGQRFYSLSRGAYSGTWFGRALVRTVLSSF